MNDTATDDIAARLRAIVHELATAGAELSAGHSDAAREHFKRANLDLTVLRVRLDRALGADHLRHAKRRRL